MKKNNNRTSFFQKIVLPALLAILLFIISVFAFIIPAFEKNVMDEKRQMLQELTNTAWSILSKYQDDVVKGEITQAEAQKKAISRIEALRYGSDKKDYFWITDMKPTMIMHPYVHELNGKSLQDFADPDGIRLFVEALKIAQTKGEGFISYRWQLKDDTKHVVPKLSFVKRFDSWNWIIGTGIYLDDVQSEITALTHKLIFISLAIIIIISLLIFFIAHQSLKIERRRQSAETMLHESREKYKSLIESSTEGIILLLNNKISYTNLCIQNWVGLSYDELICCDVNSLFVAQSPLSFDNIFEETKVEVLLKKKNNIQAEAILTILPVNFSDKFGLLLTLRDTSESRSVKNELEYLKTKLDNIYSFSNLLFFRFSLQKKIALIDFNSSFITQFGYKNELELKNTSLRDILSNQSDLRIIIKELRENKIIKNKSIKFKRKDGASFDALLSMIFVFDSNNHAHFCDGIIELVTNKITDSKCVESNNILSSAIARSLQYADDLKSKIISCAYTTPLIDVVELMNIHKSDCILLMNNQDCIGILTSKDIVSRYFHTKLEVTVPAFQIMTSPVFFIEENTKISDAYLKFSEQNTNHLIIKNSAGALTGILDWNAIKSTFIDPHELLLKTIDHCSSIQDLKGIRKQISKLVFPLLNETGSTRTISKLVSLYNDAITNQIIQIALKETGMAPVPFSFITIGSSGREEFAFNSDQDNAIIFRESETIPTEDLQNYFLKLGEKICNYLDESGLVYCKGSYMAQNKKWCQPLHVWEEYFAEWIVNSDATNILNISVFFDLRHSYGDKELFNELENYIFEIMKGRSTFFFNLAQSIAGFKPPLNVFGNIITESSGKNTETLDIKNCLSPVIMFVRIYSLYNNIRKLGTLERISDLQRLEILSPSTIEELQFQFNYLLQLRLKHQLDQIGMNMEPDNLISPKKLTEIEQIILKKIFSQMNNYQAKLSAGFMSSYKN